MKKKILKLIPKPIFKRYLKYRNKKSLNDLYKFDRDRFMKNSYVFSDHLDEQNLRSKITFHYHSIEKGLSNANFRKGFGRDAFTHLFYAMDAYIENGYDTNDSRFQQAVSTVNAYITRHKAENFEVSFVEDKFECYKDYLIENYKDVGGATLIDNKTSINFKHSNFKDLALNRHSIRDFGTEKISDDDILEAIDISTKTPSVCNRQSAKVYYIKDSDKLSKVFKLQGGLTTNGQNLQGMLLVTTNRKFMNGSHERNQTYIDGGLFLMSLDYALTYKNIASCILNTNFNMGKEIKVREILDIDMSEDLIAFVAVGSFPTQIRYANSPRDSAASILRII